MWVGLAVAQEAEGMSDVDAMEWFVRWRVYLIIHRHMAVSRGAGQRLARAAREDSVRTRPVRESRGGSGRGIICSTHECE
jgi:hypothetical protein